MHETFRCALHTAGTKTAVCVLSPPGAVSEIRRGIAWGAPLSVNVAGIFSVEVSIGHASIVIACRHTSPKS
jgi:hypothetical protein